MGDNLRHTGEAVVHCRGDGHGGDTRYIAGNPGAQRTRAGERATRAEEKHPISRSVGVCRQKSGAQPADASQSARDKDVPAASIRTVSRPAEEQTDAVATDPRWHGHELSLDGREAKTCHNGRAEEGK